MTKTRGDLPTDEAKKVDGAEATANAEATSTPDADASDEGKAPASENAGEVKKTKEELKAEKEAQKEAEKQAKAEAKAKKEAEKDSEEEVLEGFFFHNKNNHNLSTMAGDFAGGFFVAKTQEEADIIRKTEDFQYGLCEEIDAEEFAKRRLGK